MPGGKEPTKIAPNTARTAASWALKSLGNTMLARRTGSIFSGETGVDKGGEPSMAEPANFNSMKRRASLADSENKVSKSTRFLDNKSFKFLENMGIRRLSRTSNDERRGSLESMGADSFVDDGMYCNDGSSIGVCEILNFNRMMEEIEQIKSLSSEKDFTIRSKVALHAQSPRRTASGAGKPSTANDPGKANIETITDVKEQQPVQINQIVSTVTSKNPLGPEQAATYLNDFGWHPDHVIRKQLIRLTRWEWFKRLIMLTAIVHSSLVIIEAQTQRNFPLYVDVSFAGFFTMEIVLQTFAWGFMTGQYSYLNSSIYNRITFGVMICNWFEVGLRFIGMNFTSRSLRLIKLLEPFDRFRFFSGLKVIMKTLEIGIFSLGSIVILIFLFLLLFALVGMQLYDGSFSRRCVWADSLEVKIPEQWCEVMDQEDIGLNSNCGPLQRCLYIGSPNNGFTDFDDLASAMISLFQAFSQDKQPRILWPCLQANPSIPIVTVLYFFGIGVMLSKLMLNIFLAVLTTLYARVSTEDEQRDEATTDSDTDVVNGNMIEKSNVADDAKKPTDLEIQGAARPIQDDLEAVDPLANERKHNDGPARVNETAEPLTIEANQRYQEIKQRFAAIFLSQRYEVFVLWVIFSNSAYLVTYNTKFRNVQNEYLGATEYIGNSTFISNLSLTHFTNVSFIQHGLEKAKELQAEDIFSTDCWWHLFFIFDLLGRLMATGSLSKFLSNGDRLWDFFVTMGTTIAMIIDISKVNGKSESLTPNILDALAILRLIRATKISYLRPLHNIVDSAARSLPDVLSLVIFMLMMLIIFAIIGRSIFANTLENTRANFASFSVSFTTLFQVVTGVVTDYLHEALAVNCVEIGTPEDEISCLEYGGECVRCDLKNAFTSIAFYVGFFWIGQFVFLTVFLAILFQHCTIEDVLCNESLDGGHSLTIQHAQEIIATYQLVPTEEVSKDDVESLLDDLKSNMLNPEINKETLLQHLYRTEKDLLRTTLSRLGLSNLAGMVVTNISFFKSAAISRKKKKKLLSWESKGSIISPQQSELTPNEFPDLKSKKLRNNFGGRTLWAKFDSFHSNKVILVLSRCKQWIDSIVIRLALSALLEVFVALSILGGAVIQALEPPAHALPSTLPYGASEIAFSVFVVVFTIEFALKSWAFGLITGKYPKYPAYLQNFWHCYEFALLILSLWIVISKWQHKDMTKEQWLVTICRTLSGLRIMRNNQGTKLILDSLVSAAMPILFALLFLLMTLSIFGVLGMALFAEKMKFCNDSDLDGSKGEGILECVDVYLDEDFQFIFPRVWQNPSSNFDTFADAVLSLSKSFKIGWIDVWFATCDIVDDTTQPVENNNVVIASMFFISFMVCVSFFAITLFANFICDGTLATSQGEGFRYHQLQVLIKYAWPEKHILPPDTRPQLLLRALLNSRSFGALSLSCISLNCIALGLVHRGQNAQWDSSITLINDVLFGFFALETIFSMTAWGFRLYLKTITNRMDLLIVVVSYLVQYIIPSAMKVVNIIRIVRVYRIFRFFSTRLFIMRGVFDTLDRSLSRAIDICVVLFLFLTIFATSAVQICGTTKYGERLGEMGSFDDFPMSLLTLVQALFGDEVEKFLDDCAVRPPYCTEEFVDPRTDLPLGYGDCGSDYSVPFFVFFTIICDFTCTNLFIGMIIQNFMAFISQEKAFLRKDDLKELSNLWGRKFDPNGSGYIPLYKIRSFLREAPKPLGSDSQIRKNRHYLCVREDLRRKCLFYIQTDMNFLGSTASDPFHQLSIGRRIFLKLEDWERSLSESIQAINRQTQVKGEGASINARCDETEYPDQDQGAFRRLSLKRNQVMPLNDDCENNAKVSSQEKESQMNATLDCLVYDSKSRLSSGRNIEICPPNSDSATPTADSTLTPPENSENLARTGSLTSFNGNENPEKLEALSVSAEHFGSAWASPDRQEEGVICQQENQVELKEAESADNEDTVSTSDFVSYHVQENDGISDECQYDVDIADAKAKTEKHSDDLLFQSEYYEMTELRRKEAQELPVRSEIAATLPKRFAFFNKLYLYLALYVTHLLQTIFAIFVSIRSRQRHVINQLHYDRVIMAMIYWSNNQGLIPKKIIEQRQQYDASILKIASRSIIDGFIAGLIVRRRRRRLMRSIVQMRNSQTIHSLMRKGAVLDRDSVGNQDNISAGKINSNDEKWKTDIQLLIENGYGKFMRMMMNERGHDICCVGELTNLQVWDIEPILQNERIANALNAILRQVESKEKLIAKQAELAALTSKLQLTVDEQAMLSSDLNVLHEKMSFMKQEQERLKSAKQNLSKKLPPYTALISKSGAQLVEQIGIENSEKTNSGPKEGEADVTRGSSPAPVNAGLQDSNHAVDLPNQADHALFTKEIVALPEHQEHPDSVARKLEHEISLRKGELGHLEYLLITKTKQVSSGGNLDKMEQAKEKRSILFDPNKTASLSTAFAMVDAVGRLQRSGSHLKKSKAQPNWL